MGKQSTFSQRLREGLDIRRMTQAELSRLSGVSKSSITHYLKGNWEAKQDAIYAMAGVLGVAEAWLMGYDVPMERTPATITLPTTMFPYAPKGQMPLLGRVAAGLPLYAEENIEGYIANDFTDGEVYYGLRVQGDSMNAAGIDDGDIVVVRQQSTVDSNQIAVVLVNGNDATIKYVQQQGNMVILSPRSHNPVHQIQIYDITKIRVEIIGRVVQCRKAL